MDTFGGERRTAGVVVEEYGKEDGLVGNICKANSVEVVETVDELVISTEQLDER